MNVQLDENSSDEESEGDESMKSDDGENENLKVNSRMQYLTEDLSLMFFSLRTTYDLILFAPTGA